MTNRFRCEYCKSYSHEDMRGNCGCCGAPREMHSKLPEVCSMEYARQKMLGAENPSPYGYKDGWQNNAPCSTNFPRPLIDLMVNWRV